MDLVHHLSLLPRFERDFEAKGQLLAAARQVCLGKSRYDAV